MSAVRGGGGGGLGGGTSVCLFTVSLTILTKQSYLKTRHGWCVQHRS